MSKNKNVYIVSATDGYSPTYIYGLLDSMSDAQLLFDFMKSRFASDNDIDDLEVREMSLFDIKRIKDLRNKELYYCICSRDGDIDIKISDSYVCFENEIRHGNTSVWGYIWASNRDEAIKIIEDERDRRIAAGEWEK